MILCICLCYDGIYSKVDGREIDGEDVSGLSFFSVAVATFSKRS